MIQQILEQIRRLPGDHPLVVAIDGRCASGKSTLAAKLQQGLHCPVFSLDDFFLRPQQRTPNGWPSRVGMWTTNGSAKRYCCPGGKVNPFATALTTATGKC